jgi:hypothetical protein
MEGGSAGERFSFATMRERLARKTRVGGRVEFDASVE